MTDLKTLLAEWADDFEEASLAMPTRLQKVILMTRAQECRDMLETLSEPCGWMYDIATFTDSNGGYYKFHRQMSVHKPNAPRGSIVNLTPLYKLGDL